MSSYEVELRIHFRLEASSPNEAMQQLLQKADDESWPPSENIEYVIRSIRGQSSPAAQVTDAIPGLDRPAYTVSEAAAVLGVSKSAMYELVATGRAQCIRLGKRSIRIPRASLQKVLSGEGMAEVLNVPVRRPIQRRHTSIIEPRQKAKPTPKKPEAAREVFNTSDGAASVS